MNTDLPEELLSGLLDGELSPSERSRVEQHLASHPADRQLLEELRALREDLQRLEPVAVRPDFAQRVVQAALAAGQAHQLAPSGHAGRPRRVRWSAVMVGLASVAAMFLIGLWLASRLSVAPFGRHEPQEPRAPLAGPSVSSPPAGEPGSVAPSPSPAPQDTVVEPLRRALAATGSGEALVVRLRVGSDFPSGTQLDAVLRQAGLTLRPPSDLSTGASALAPLWRRQVQQRLGGAGVPQSDLAAALSTPSDALWVEGSLEDLQAVLRQLGRQSAITVVPEARLAATPRAAEVGEAEGEPGQVRGQASTDPPAAGPLAQHVPPTLFPLPPQPAASELGPPEGEPSGRRRVLLLIERVP
jgi:hypothetical protein